MDKRDDGVTWLVAEWIIDAASNGERDPAKLFEHGIYNSGGPPPAT